MPVGLLTLELYIPEAHSLKDKRQVVRSLKDRLRKRFKDDASEVRTGFECGAGIANFNDVKVGDFLECFSVLKLSAAEAAAQTSGAGSRK